MARRPKQLDLLPFPKQSASERKQWIQDRLHGYEFRQAAREAARRDDLDRRKRRRESEGEDDRRHGRQLTIEDAIRRLDTPASP